MQRLDDGLDQVLDDLHLPLDVDLAIRGLHEQRTPSRSAASCAPCCISMKKGLFSVLTHECDARRAAGRAVVALADRHAGTSAALRPPRGLAGRVTFMGRG